MSRLCGRAPGFWGLERPDARARLLALLGALYGAVAARRLASPAESCGLPALAVGGLTVGGDGKTPLALALADLLEASGMRPAFLTRGYGGGVGRGPARVESGDSALYGDEALLLAARAPTFVGADRRAGARAAAKAGAGALILDDGFHSRRLRPDCALLVADADFGAGNGFCPPAGPLRAPLAAQIAAADALVVASLDGGGEGRAAPVAALARAAGKPVFAADLVAEDDAALLAGGRVFAVCGVGRPEKFRRTLERTGADVAGLRAFPDHWRFRRDEIEAAARKAQALGARLVTTQKDFARWPAGAPEPFVVGARMRFRDPAAASRWLVRKLQPAGAGGIRPS